MQDEVANTGNIGSGFSSGGAYAQSFGNLPDNTRYLEVDCKSLTSGKPQYNIDIRETLNEKATQIGLKALETTSGGAGTAGYAMVPIYVDPRVVDTTRRYTPLVELIPRVTNQGMTADYNKITAKGAAVTAAEDAALTEADDTYDRASTSIKFIYSVGRVTGPAIAAMPSWILQGLNPAGGATGSFSDAGSTNSKQLTVLVKTRAIREKEESLIVNGDAGSDATQFSGIVTLQSTTNKVDKNTTAMTLDDINTAIQYAFDDGGRPNLAVCSSAVFTDLLGLLTAKIGYMQPTQQVFWGFSTIVLNTMVGQVPVIPSTYLSNVSGSKAIYFLDMSVWEMRVLQDLTYEDLAKTNDSEKFMLKIYEALICKNTAFNSFIGEIA